MAVYAVFVCMSHTKRITALAAHGHLSAGAAGVNEIDATGKFVIPGGASALLPCWLLFCRLALRMHASPVRQYSCVCVRAHAFY